MKYETLELTCRNKTAVIILNRPERLNSFNMQLGAELLNALRAIRFDDDIKVVTITGKGDGFCSGGDVKEMHSAKDKARFIRKLTRMIHKCVIEIRSMNKPVIAIVNGAAYGAGLSLALACDIIIASEKAKFGTAFIGIGLAPGCGTQFFTNTAGYHRACEYILTGKSFDADKALELGLVNRVVSEDELYVVAEEYINLFRDLPSFAVGRAKYLINKSMHNDMISHLKLESRNAALSAKMDDFKEGVSAFIEKRKPIFKK
ncbi:MAG: enoyl-CoA hydratase/isomerase family protein [Candidatus Thermoplasmatota archaeon]